MLDKKFLAEYSSKEKAEFRKYLKSSIKNPTKPYPPYSRFGEIKNPIVHSDPHVYTFDHEKIWSQIPFAGTLMVSIHNVPEKLCLSQNGFEPSDIPNLIQLAKETGKIKFGLQTDPLHYEGLDYLEPLIREFEPPVFYYPEKTQIPEIERKKWANELVQLASPKYFKELRYNVLKSGGSDKFVDALIEGRGSTWEKMKILGMDSEIEHLSNLIVDNSEEAESLFSSYIMTLSPMLDPFTHNYNYSLSRLNEYGVPAIPTENIRIPEIGKFILKKLALKPENYFGCIEVIQKYDDNDLYKLLDSFESAIKNKKSDKILKTKEELKKIIDNVWDDVTKTVSNKRCKKWSFNHFRFGRNVYNSIS